VSLIPIFFLVEGIYRNGNVAYATLQSLLGPGYRGPGEFLALLVLIMIFVYHSERLASANSSHCLFRHCESVVCRRLWH